MREQVEITLRYEGYLEKERRQVEAFRRSEDMLLPQGFDYMTLDGLRAQLRPRAEKQVKLRLALETIARQEKLTVTEDAIEGEYTRISEQYNMPVDQVKTMVAREEIEADMLTAAAMDLVKEKAVTKAPAKAKAESEEQ